jgi:hypothetical protein
MARKRMIDPAIWSDSKVIQLTSKEFVIWLGCISNADDEGIFEADPASFYFKIARQDIAIQEISDAFTHLARLSMIRAYGRFAFIPTWFKHQVLNRPNETKNQRPTEKLLSEHPEYVSAWETTFSTQNKPKKYPLNTCSEDSVSTHGILSEYSVPMEWNGIEEKGKEINMVPDDPWRDEPEEENPADKSAILNIPSKTTKEKPAESVPPKPKNPKPPIEEPTDFKTVVASYFRIHEREKGEKPLWGDKEGKLLKTLLATGAKADRINDKLELYYTKKYWFTRDGCQTFAGFIQHYSKIIPPIVEWQDEKGKTVKTEGGRW